MKKAITSKINWTAIVLILISVLPIIEAQNFSTMQTKDWITFGIGILIIILRTYFTNTKIPTPTPTPTPTP